MREHYRYFEFLTPQNSTEGIFYLLTGIWEINTTYYGGSERLSSRTDTGERPWRCSTSPGTARSRSRSGRLPNRFRRLCPGGEQIAEFMSLVQFYATSNQVCSIMGAIGDKGPVSKSVCGTAQVTRVHRSELAKLRHLHVSPVAAGAVE